jgi:hypothetical protein
LRTFFLRKTSRFCKRRPTFETRKRKTFQAPASSTENK